MSGQRAVAVVLDGDRVLVMKRYLHKPDPELCIMCRTLGPAIGPDGPYCAGHDYAVLPGGHIEEGEPAEVAAVRELEEETTLRGRVDHVLWTGRHNERTATYFLMAEVVGSPTLSGPELAKNNPENSFELVWARADELDLLGLHPAEVREPLAKLISG